MAKRKNKSEKSKPSASTAPSDETVKTESPTAADSSTATEALSSPSTAADTATSGAGADVLGTVERVDAPIGEGVQVSGQTADGAALPAAATETVPEALPAEASGDGSPEPHDTVRAARETLERVCRALSSGDAEVSGYVSRSPSPRLTARQGQTLTRIAAVLECKRDQAIGQLLDLIADASVGV